MISIIIFCYRQTVVLINIEVLVFRQLFNSLKRRSSKSGNLKMSWKIGKKPGISLKHFVDTLYKLTANCRPTVFI